MRVWKMLSSQLKWMCRTSEQWDINMKIWYRFAENKKVLLGFSLLGFQGTYNSWKGEMTYFCII